MKMGQNLEEVYNMKGPLTILMYFFYTGFYTTTIETTTGVFSMRTDGRLETTDTLECSRVHIGENQFLIVKNALLTLRLFATNCIICFLHLLSALHTPFSQFIK